MAISKSEFAQRLGVSRPTVSRYCAMGMTGHLEDGQIDEDVARQWVKDTIRPHVSDASSGGHIGAAGGEPDDAIEALTEAEIDIAQERARWQKARADLAELAVAKERGGTEEVVKIRTIETIVHWLWMCIQRQSPGALVDRLLRGNCLPHIKLGNPEDMRPLYEISGYIKARDCMFLRDAATEIERIIAGVTSIQHYDNADKEPWQSHIAPWADANPDAFERTDDQVVEDFVTADGELKDGVA